MLSWTTGYSAQNLLDQGLAVITRDGAETSSGAMNLEKVRQEFVELIERKADRKWLSKNSRGDLTLDDIEEICQQAALKGWKGLAGFRGDGDLRTWYIELLKNEATRFFSRKHRHRELPEESIDGAGISVENTGPANVCLSELRELIESLDEPYRKILRLRFLEGRTIEEIAEALNIPEGTAKSRQHEGIRRLQRLIKKIGRIAYDGRKK
jgi:RNA polymerase sigma-70 factor (ECF subfamily)